MTTILCEIREYPKDVKVDNLDELSPNGVTDTIYQAEQLIQQLKEIQEAREQDE